LRIINLNPAPAICFKEKLYVIVHADVKTQRDVRDVNVARITIIIAVSNAESELPATQR
jgi:hypothetical protein